MLLAIDPGTRESAIVCLDAFGVPKRAAKYPNDVVLEFIDGARSQVHHCVIEMVASFGMPVGAEVFETVYWIGRFADRFGADWVTRITRNEVKNNLCHSSRANDASIRQAIIDRFGGKEVAIGKKKNPGPLFGIAGDEWSALAVGLTYLDRACKAGAQGL